MGSNPTPPATPYLVCPGDPQSCRPRVRSERDQRFHRLDTMNGLGLGLGLSVVQGLVEAIGGVIRAEEAPGGGAAFRIRFPRPARTMSENALTDTLSPRVSTTSEIARSVS